MLLAWPWTQRNYSAGEEQGGKCGQLATPTLLLERGLRLAHSQAPYCFPMLSSRPSIQGPGLTVSGDLGLCVPQYLILCSLLHPHLDSRLFSLLSSPCRGHRNHSCPSSSDSSGLGHRPLSPSGAVGFGWLVRSRGPAPLMRCKKQCLHGVYPCARPVFVALPSWARVSRYKNASDVVSILYPQCLAEEVI